LIRPSSTKTEFIQSGLAPVNLLPGNESNTKKRRTESSPAALYESSRNST
jgi:hypothetical protein